MNFGGDCVRFFFSFFLSIFGVTLWIGGRGGVKREQQVKESRRRDGIGY